MNHIFSLVHSWWCDILTKKHTKYFAFQRIRLYNSFPENCSVPHYFPSFVNFVFSLWMRLCKQCFTGNDYLTLACTLVYWMQTILCFIRWKINDIWIERKAVVYYINVCVFSEVRFPPLKLSYYLISILHIFIYLHEIFVLMYNTVSSIFENNDGFFPCKLQLAHLCFRKLSFNTRKYVSTIIFCVIFPNGVSRN